MNKQRYVLTGGTGAIGSALVHQLLKDNHEVLIIAHPGSTRIIQEAYTSNNCKIIECDLNAYASLQLEDTYDIFMHLAWSGTTGSARDDDAIQKENILGTIDAVNLAKKLGCHTFVGVGSQAEYGRYNICINETFVPHPETAYGKAKLEASKEALQFCKENHINAIWARVCSVYGPHDRTDSLISYCVKNMLEKKPLSLTACEQVWDFLYEEDAAKALLQLASQGKNQEIYNVAYGESHILKEYIESIARQTNYNLPIGFGVLPYQDNQVMHLEMSIDKLKNDTGFTPSILFEQGIENLIKWYERREEYA